MLAEEEASMKVPVEEEKARSMAEEERARMLVEEEARTAEEEKMRSMAEEECARMLAEEGASTKAATEEEKAQLMVEEERGRMIAEGEIRATQAQARAKAEPDVRTARAGDEARAEEAREGARSRNLEDARARVELAVAEGRRLLEASRFTSSPSLSPFPRDAAGSGDCAPDFSRRATATTTSGASGSPGLRPDDAGRTLVPDRSAAAGIRNARASGDLPPRFNLSVELVGLSETECCELRVREAVPAVTSATTTSVGGGESRYVNDDDVDTILVSDDPGVFALIAVDKRGGRARGIVRKDGESIEFAQDGDGGGVSFEIKECLVSVSTYEFPLLSHRFSAGFGQHRHR